MATRRFRSGSVVPLLTLVAVLGLLLGLASRTAAVAQEAEEETPPEAADTAHPRGPDGKLLLTFDDYPGWKNLGEETLSPDGRWFAYAHEPVEGDDTLFVRSLERLDGTPVDTAVNGTDVAFSGDSRWVAYVTTPPEDDGEDGPESGDEDRSGRTLHLVDLAGGGGEEVASFENVASFDFSGDARWLAVEKRPPESGNGGNGEDRPRGADLLLHDLRAQTTTNLGNVAAHAFNESGALLAYVVDAPDDAGNGAYLMDLTAGRTVPLSTAERTYEGLSWSEDGSAVAVLRGMESDSLEERSNALLAWRGLEPGVCADGEVRAACVDELGVEYRPSEDEAFPEGFVLSEHRTPEWSEDNARLFVGIREQREALSDDEKVESNVVVWHWKDERLQSRQEVEEMEDRRFTYLAALNLGPDGHSDARDEVQGSGAAEGVAGSRGTEAVEFVRLATPGMERVEPTSDGDRVIGYSDNPYRLDRDHPDNRADVYEIDPATGERTLIADSLVWPLGPSPDGRRFLYFRDSTLYAHDLEADAATDLSAAAPGAELVNSDWDYPTEAPAWGTAGWSDDRTSVVVYDEFDVWRIAVDGSEAENLTAGAGVRDSVRYRVRDIEPDEPGEPDALDLTEPLLLHGYGEWTKREGWYRTREGRSPEALHEGDEHLDGLARADSAEVVVFTRETFRRFPDVWTADTDFDDPERVTHANPQQDDFSWGSRRLIEYTDDRGNRLQATVTLPPGYQEGERYPTIIYFYEQFSQRHHSYAHPTWDDRPHASYYASQGYVFIMPDIVYTEGRPGSSALDDVTAVAERAIELGISDPDRIGLQGHSWGGYESSFILTRSDMFSAVVTGAPLTNLVSMYDILYKRLGIGNGPLLEWSQGRMGSHPWNDWDGYLEQSPIHHAADISTPFIVLHGTEDGAVDWNQGLELYTAARRLGKEGILLSYPGEPHHLQDEANQKDFQRRMKQFFDHHLVGAEAPVWLEEGVDYIDRSRIPVDAYPGSGGVHP